MWGLSGNYLNNFDPVLTKNKLDVSDEVISFRIYDQSYSQIGFNQYVINKMVDSYSYVYVLNHCPTCGRA